MRDELAEALQALAPAGIALASLPLDDLHLVGLHPQEAAIVERAGIQRRREFATGRALLHRLLPGRAPILRTATGAPHFDAATVGSLAHDRHHALGAVAAATAFAALGVDLEPKQEHADDELAEAVLRTDDSAVDPLAAFTMKEAAYKAWSTMGGGVVGPLDVRLSVTGARFRAWMPHSPATIDGPPSTVDGAVASAAGYWLALAVVPLPAGADRG